MLTFCRGTKRLKDFDDVKLSIFPNAPVLRKAKEHRLLERYGLLSANPILSLLQSSNLLQNILVQIYSITYRLLEFFVFIEVLSSNYYTYKARSKKSIKFYDNWCYWRSYKTIFYSEPSIFLYQCIYVDIDRSILVFQMISAYHKSMHILCISYAR